MRSNMPNHHLIELPLADHLEVTDKHSFPKEYFKWPDLGHVNVVRLASANPSRQISFKSLPFSEIAEKIGYLALCQTNPFSTMRFEVTFLENGNMDLTYTGFNLSPIDMQSTTGHSLFMALEYYQNKKDSIVLYASYGGYYWMTRPS